MGSYRQRFLHNLTTFVALLRGVAGVHSNDLMSSTCSLGFKNVEECAPTGVHDAFRKSMILEQVENTQLLNRKDLILFGILLSNFIVKVSSLPFDLQMRFCRVSCCFSSSFTVLLAPAQLALLASQRFLRGAIETRVLHGVALAIGEEGLEPYVNADVSMLTGAWVMFCLGLRLTDNEGYQCPSAL